MIKRSGKSKRRYAIQTKVKLWRWLYTGYVKLSGDLGQPTLSYRQWMHNHIRRQMEKLAQIQ